MAKIKDVVGAAEQLSLGISIVVAVLIGVGLGIWLKNITGLGFMLWVGVVFGVAAAILNIKKAYQQQIKSLDELKDENRYKFSKDNDEI
ncbi:arginine biosynthesis protein ArgJ [Campylobacter pinnipediorum subsp. pinnipediorum]|uniref:Arginine biosynthesis protein ArgJ n=1 Tax=Campylobacter pinnipediorum subsp. pinnipediorum TaxID=1660067 RepID=A0AAX0LC84_9BACT|nr:AtpZ/AtpI family protein [Campylobacter pinnipediorum]OPA81658.1 arginine biosynthesis protein ArgJ [Campylobacter pinnipediorum subsp. pinnipediorum]